MSTTVLLTASELDILSAPAVLAEARHKIAAAGAVDVVLDLVFVRFLDARGIGEIVQLRNELLSSGGRLRIERWTRRIGQVLSITGLLGMLREGVARPERGLQELTPGEVQLGLG